MAQNCKITNANAYVGFLTQCTTTTLRNVAIDLYDSREKARWDDIFEKRCNDLSFLYWSCSNIRYVCEKLLTVFHDSEELDDKLEPWTDLRTTSLVQLLTPRTVLDVCTDIISNCQSSCNFVQPNESTSSDLLELKCALADIDETLSQQFAFYALRKVTLVNEPTSNHSVIILPDLSKEEDDSCGVSVEPTKHIDEEFTPDMEGIKAYVNDFLAQNANTDTFAKFEEEFKTVDASDPVQYKNAMAQIIATPEIRDFIRSISVAMSGQAEVGEQALQQLADFIAAEDNLPNKDSEADN